MHGLDQEIDHAAVQIGSIPKGESNGIDGLGLETVDLALKLFQFLDFMQGAANVKQGMSPV